MTELRCRHRHKQKTHPMCFERKGAEPPVDSPNVLVYDIETSTATYKTYPRTGKVWLNPSWMTEKPYMLGWSGKWLLDTEVHSSFVSPEEAVKRDDERVTRELHRMIDRADYVITYNGNRFDNKEITSRFLKYGLTPTKYQSIDLYQKVKQICRLPGYSLRYVLKEFGLSPKGDRVDTDKAEEGDAEALKKDEAYCKQDVLSEEELYVFLRPHMKTHPSMSVLMDRYTPLEEDEAYCPRCTGVVHIWRWEKRYAMPSGNMHKATNCPHCRSVIYKAERLHEQQIIKS